MTVWIMLSQGMQVVKMLPTYCTGMLHIISTVLAKDMFNILLTVFLVLAL